MAQKGIIKNTIAEGHIDASDFAEVLHGIIGSNGVLDYKDKLELVKLNNNLIRIKSGLFNLHGHIIQVSNYTDLSVDSGSLGTKRYDYIIGEYKKNGVEVGTDLLHLRILKGTPHTTTPQRPVLTNTSSIYQSVLCELLITDNELSIPTTTFPIAIKSEKIDLVWSGKLARGDKISIDLNKYKRVRFYYDIDGSGVSELDLTTPAARLNMAGYPYQTSPIFGAIDTNVRAWMFMLLINTAKNEVFLRDVTYRDLGASASAPLVKTYYFIYKIEGIY